MKIINRYTISALCLLVLGVSLGLYLWWPQAVKPTFRQVHFKHLPGWNKASFTKSLQAFQVSCRAFVKHDPERVVGTDAISLQAKDWQPACHAALAMSDSSEQLAKLFFEQWFAPVEFYGDKPVNGLFTGYYMPSLKGSYTKTAEYNVPLYQVPSDMLTIDLELFLPHAKNKKIIGRLAGNKIVPYFTREQINNGALKDKAKVLMWIRDPVDRLFLEIQGSGIVELDDGSRVFVGYDGQNGAPYTAIAGILIKQGVMTKHNASMQGIKRYFAEHPEQRDKIINQNKSFIFFRKLSLDGALGSQGVPLTPGYSLAIDRQWIPMGAPLWLSTTRPDSKKPDRSKPMQRLMIAQDTGGAIKGKVRGDVFWGGGERATLIAGHMKNEGHYWLLLPKHIVPLLGKKS